MTKRDREFAAESTTDEVLEGIDLSGKRVLITGGSSGLGVESARAMAAHGATVTVTARDVGKAEAAMAAVRQATGNDRVDVMELELDVPDSVRAFAKRFLERNEPLDIQINNAGVMACPLARTAEGWEQQFATNHLGHFLTTCLLAPSLRASGNARVVSVSSGGHRFAGVEFDDIHFESRPYDKFAAYGQAKTANVLFAVELDRRLADRGVHANAIHPGMIMTELGRHLTEDDIKAMMSRRGDDGGGASSSGGSGGGGGGLKFKPIEAGAATQVYAATAPELEGVGAMYLEDCQVSLEPGERDGTVFLGCADYARDPELAARLWQVSEDTLGERFDFS